MVRFQYKKEIDKDGASVWRPVADVWLPTSTNDWIELHPYIDSGADITLVPYSFGKLLGFKKVFARKQRIGGIGGHIEIITVKWKIKIGEKVMNADIGWAQSENVPALLGRQNIFDEFEILFRQKEKEILFK